MRRSNCIIFAVKLYARRRRKGEHGYIVVRKSHWGWFPHMLYARVHRGKVRLVSYVPNLPKPKGLPAPLFRGKPMWGDIPGGSDEIG